MSSSAIIADVLALTAGDPVFMAGSLVAEEAYGKTNAHSDIDLFCPTQNVLISQGQKLLGQGFTLDDRMARTWYRWLRYGTKNWHTNSLRMQSPQGHELNLVYKLTDGHPATSLAQVIESFDFGLLAVGYDCESGTRRDMRSYLFEGMDPDGPLPMMPNKRANWREGFISQYNGVRECGRYAKYHGYGYDLSLVQDDLVTGYYEAASYLTTHFDEDKRQLGDLYQVIGQHIELDNIDHLSAAAKLIDYKDSLDAIMEALE